MVLIMRWLILLAWLFWIGFYWQAGRRAAADFARSLQPDHPPLDRWLMAAIGLMMPVIGVTMLLILLQAVLVDPMPDGLIGLGAALTLIGMGGTFYCRHYLGRFWTAETTLLTGHQIVDRGPYGLVRHPIYTSACVMYFGTALVFLVWWLVLAVTIVIGAYVLKANLEDQFLARRLSGYEDYRKRVKYRLLPGVW